jgi:hypothetical protein
MAPLATEACDYAADILKKAGFAHRYTSMKSEACYYGLDPHPGVIRVAMHRHGHGDRTLMPIFAKLTFREGAAGASGGCLKSWQQLDEMIARAVGHYLLRATGALPMDAVARADAVYRMRRERAA